MHKFLIITLLAGPPTPPIPTSTPASAPEVQRPTMIKMRHDGPPPPKPREEPKDPKALYREGSTRYDAADYEGAIEKFTEALNLVGTTHKDRETRLLLLYNIASAHEKQYTIDEEPTHLRQALALYERYREFARTQGDLHEELDVGSRIARVKELLRKAQEDAGTQDVSDDRPADPVQEEGRPRPRQMGIAFVASGSALTLGGVILAVVGSQLEGRARAQVDELGGLNVPPDHPAWAAGEQFVESERQKGRAVIGAGVALAVVGVAGVGVGSYFLVKSKKNKGKHLSLTPTFTRGAVGLRLGGRF